MTGNYTETLAEEEAVQYRANAVNAKFKQQIAYGVGAAMVFGLVSVLGKALADVAGAAMATQGAGITMAALSAAALPLVGLAALGVMGVGLLYLSAKYLSENIINDQALQAKQICAATHGKAPEQTVAPAVAPKIQEFPAADAASKTETTEANVVPLTTIGNERELADTIMPRNQQVRVA